jgi:putative sigma-54 modulation protein
MRLQVKAHNGTINDTVRAYAEKRLAKLGRRLQSDTVVELTLSREFNPSIREDHSADAVVYTKGPNIVARESAETYEAAIDQLVDKLERQVERYKDKRTHEPRRTAQKQPQAPPVPVEQLEELAEAAEELAEGAPEEHGEAA